MGDLPSEHVFEHEYECVFQLPMLSLITVPCEAIYCTSHSSLSSQKIILCPPEISGPYGDLDVCVVCPLHIPEFPHAGSSGG